MFSIPQPHLQAVGLFGVDMNDDVGFSPIRIDKGESCSLAIGSDGETMKITSGDSNGQEITFPFPGPTSCGAIISDRWIGSWANAGIRKAFMGSFPLDLLWMDAGRESEEDSNKQSPYVSKSAIWTRELQSEPVAMCNVGENLAFVCLRTGIYMIDSEAREIWRSPYPVWRELEDISNIDSIVSIVHKDDELYCFTSSGGFSIISASSGIEKSNGILPNLPGRVHRVMYDNGSGWIIMLHGRNVVFLADLFANVETVSVPGPVLDAFPVPSGWVWTGWRHDGIMQREAPSGEIVTKVTYERDEIGIAILDYKVLTNSGTWSDLSPSVKSKIMGL
tara:strand:- start:8697 stop:9698 length:1002 start_codon:yes stop_codon:yes gene_type:complete